MTRIWARMAGAGLMALLPCGILALSPVLRAAPGHRAAKPGLEAATAARRLTPRQQLTRDLTISHTVRGSFPAHPPYVPSDVWTGIDFVSGTTGWVAGYGRILGTRDGGRLWAVQYRGRLPLAGIAMWNARIGYTYSPSEILATENGGAFWAPVSSPRGTPSQVIPVGPHTVYAIASQRLYESLDNGQVWRRVRTPDPVSSVVMTPAGVGYAVDAAKAAIWKTADGGQRWTPVLRLNGGMGGRVAMAGGAIWAVIYGGAGMNQQSYTVYRSTDAGRQWKAVAAHPTAGGGPAPGSPRRSVPVAPGLVLADFAAPSPKTVILATGCWVCGDGTAALAVTTDGGTHWQSMPAIAGYSGFSARVSFVSATRGWMATGAGLILETSDGGRTWSPVYPSSRTAPVYGWSWVSNREAFGLGTIGRADVLLETTNGGGQWRMLAHLPSGQGDHIVPYAQTEPIDFVSAGDGWLAVPSSGQLIHVVNGRLIPVPPATFKTPSDPEGSVTNVYFTNRRDGGVSVGFDNGTYVTTNGGRTWHPLPDIEGSTAVLAIHHPALARVLNQLSRNSGVIGFDSIGIRGPQLWMSALNRMMYSHNGGRTWTMVVGGTLGNSMLSESPSGRLYVYVAGRYFVSANDGASWSPLP